MYSNTTIVTVIFYLLIVYYLLKQYLSLFSLFSAIFPPEKKMMTNALVGELDTQSIGFSMIINVNLN